MQVQAKSSGNSALTWSATGLPAGLSIDATTGLITGTPTTIGACKVRVTATDSTGACGPTLFTWDILAAG